MKAEHGGAGVGGSREERSGALSWDLFSLSFPQCGHTHALPLLTHHPSVVTYLAVHSLAIGLHRSGSWVLGSSSQATGYAKGQLGFPDASTRF